MDAATDSHSLERAGLLVASYAPRDGDKVFVVRGNTHAHRHLLRELGGQWDRMQQAWVFQGEDPRPGILEKLSDETPSYGLADAGQAQLTNRPHYWGHRQRLRERFLHGNEDDLPNYELLELLLFYSIPRVDTKPLAKELLTRFETLAGVINAEPEQLAEFERMNQHTVTLFKAVQSFSKRLAREELSERPVFDNWDKLIAFLMASMAHRKVEQFRVLFLDRMNVLLADEVQHEGTIDHTAAYPREVVKRALQLDASAVVIVHNHPSNHPKPSKADIAMTRDMQSALEKIGITLHDHIIVSRRGHTSFKQMGLIATPTR